MDGLACVETLKPLNADSLHVMKSDTSTLAQAQSTNVSSMINAHCITKASFATGLSSMHPPQKL